MSFSRTLNLDLQNIQKIEDYKKKNKIKSFSKALNQILDQYFEKETDSNPNF